MDRSQVLALLQAVASGSVSAEDAIRRLAHAPFETLDFATIDHHRALRLGYPEVIYAEGKTPHQVVTIAERTLAHGGGALVTRTDEPTRLAMQARFPEAIVNTVGRTVRVGPAAGKEKGTVLIITAGTSDLPVAEEAAESALAMGNVVGRLNDVGVAGLHRLLANGNALQSATVAIVVAGMDGALPSVVGGLVACPVIAVPTSVGYGASLGGLAALFTMLNSCAAGVTVVNIDNGFGAAAAATRIAGVSRLE
ncbi:MAG TPA: nickel pincer cofactor biosynthesis protein LarB [Gemmatimonadaceae bacterium]